MFTPSIFQPVIRTKWIPCSPVVLFAHEVKKIEGATNKNGLKNATCNALQFLKSVLSTCQICLSWKSRLLLLVLWDFFLQNPIKYQLCTSRNHLNYSNCPNHYHMWENVLHFFKILRIKIGKTQCTSLVIFCYK